MSDKPAGNTPQGETDKKDALEDDTKVIYQLYLDGFITIHEVDIMLKDLDSEYENNRRA